MANSVGLHEAPESIRAETKDNHRALTSMMEELEAIDWYDQRIDAAVDSELQGLLAHNRDEEKEHFSMLLEWLRRRDAKLAAHLGERLFKKGAIVTREEAKKVAAAETAAARSEGSLGIGSLRREPALR